MHTVDRTSKAQSQFRADAYLTVRQEIERLKEERQKYNSSSARHKQLDNKIVFLEALAKNLNSYQDAKSRTAYIEYGLSENQSCGVARTDKTNIAANNDASSNFSTETTEIFYKFQLLRTSNFLFTTQPKIIIAKDNYRQEELFREISFLAGLAGKRKRYKLFTDGGISFNHCLNCSLMNKSSYSLNLSEGIKFANKFMLINFTKYYIRQNYGNLYSKTLYEQFSVVKEISFGNIKKNSLAVQLGYFWDKSLTYSTYQSSGLVFSTWINV